MSENRVFKKELNNGLTVLVMPRKHIPKVSTQLLYNVGSKHEKEGEKGIAHLIEHMVFKGTERLSESDINLITAKLSGNCNAFTSYDYTGYMFDFPTQHWHYSLAIFADCMRNCTFKQELLNSELKAVIQELKMYKDDYSHAIIDELMSAIFIGHSYGYPIIGYKRDLWNLDSKRLKDFYLKHYVPNNATLVIVGDVEPEEAFKQAEYYFGQIPAGEVEKPKDFYLEKDLAGRSVTLYRDVKQSIVTCAFVVPGALSKVDYVLDTFSWLVGSGRGSRLYKKLVEELRLVTEVGSFSYDLFEHGLFVISVQPRDPEKIPEILTQIKLAIKDAIDNGFSEEEFERAQAQTKTALFGLFESNQHLSGALGRTYLASGDENYLLHYQDLELPELEKAVKQLLEQYVRPQLMNTGIVLPLQKTDSLYWQSVQNISDQEDKRVLNGKERSAAIEDGSFVSSVEPKEFSNFNYPKYELFTLSNGLEILYYNDTRIPKIEAVLEFKADHLYDPDDKQGVNNFMSQMLLKGTGKYSAMKLAELVERKGMSLSSVSGFMFLSMLRKDCAAGLDVLADILTNSVFSENAVEQVRHKIFTDIADYWDRPYQFVNDLVGSQIYAGHPYGKNALGTVDSVKSISRDDLVLSYKNYISPKGARLALIGDLSSIEIKKVLEETIGKWQGPEVKDIDFPSLSGVDKKNFKYVINRDQVVLSFAGLSIDRNHPDYDKILLFDQIFSGSALGVMSSRLFQVREKTGLFYTIAGSLLARSGRQPGLVFVKTIVSLDRLGEAEKAIGDVIKESADTLQEDELQQAKQGLAHAMVDNFESYRQIASAFLYLRRYNLPIDYFDKRAEQLNQYDVNVVKDAANKIMNFDKMHTFYVGRV